MPARGWLVRQAANMDGAAHEEMIAAAPRVLDTPDWSAIFASGALAEVPLAATVGGQVITGTIDRLLVTESRVRLVDFKTARRPPESIAAIPSGTLRQMAAYVAALGVIYPGREVEACVLYTHVPRLFVLPDDLLDAHKPGFAG